MKIIDNEGRLFGRLSVIDLFCILLVLVLAAAVALRLVRASGSEIIVNNELVARENVTVEYKIKISGVRSFTSEAIRIGDLLKDNDSSNAIGEITDIEISNTRAELTRQDGTFVLAENPERYDVVITVRASGFKNENGRLYLDRNYLLNANKNVSLHSKYYSTSGAVLDIRVVG